MNATLSEDRLTFTIYGTRWHETLPVAFLPSRLRFYTALRDRKGAPDASRAVHAETVTALEAVDRLLKASTPVTPNPGGAAA
ncbi:hypothetical protein HKCCE4037_06505 [Rhodobacterales bacterium HKCCE4037]|nr:hypothetical protein [Rhodobacterales bacterium HKCCE4037]